ncbi:MAG: hypothetical protein F6K17_07295 [Okeania sp. SIO3C4]|nr:hypothetical protein [Okeania sp. SIO3C4]
MAEGRRKKEEVRRKKGEGKILCYLSFKFLICPRLLLRPFAPTSAGWRK